MNSIYINLPDSPPDGRRLWVDEKQFNIDRSGKPTPSFTVGEAAKTFFGKSPRYLRIMLYQDPEYLVFDGEPLEYKLYQGHRFMSLSDIEKTAHALIQTGKPNYTVVDFATTLNIVKYCALSHGYLNLRGERVDGKDIHGRTWKNANKKRVKRKDTQ